MTNAKFCRNFICAGLGALALSYVPLSHAGYAQLAPPAGYSPGGGPGGSMTVPTAAAANGASYLNGTVRTNAALNVGGRAVAVPAASRMAMNAGRVAAAAVMLHPALRTGVAVAGWLGLAGLVYDATSGLWSRPDPDVESSRSDGWVYYIYGQSQRYGTAAQLCALEGGTPYNKHVAGFYQGCDSGSNRWTIWSDRSGCPTGWYVTPAGCVQTPPMKTVTEKEFVDGVSDNPMPANVPLEIPYPLPVEIPEIVPLFIPTGDPVKNPNYNPSAPPSPENQPFVQPGINVQPAPSPSSPWQVDLQPVNRPVANPKPGSDPVPNTNPDGSLKPNPGDQPREDSKEDRDFCDKHPDVIACQKVDTEVENKEIPKAQKTVTYMPENPFGGGACPADQYARVGGQQIKVVDWTRDCQFVRDYVTPIAFVLTTLIVGAILLGGLKP